MLTYIDPRYFDKNIFFFDKWHVELILAGLDIYQKRHNTPIDKRSLN
jgi:hypothetical protein